jgi:hypothetical protein
MLQCVGSCTIFHPTCTRRCARARARSSCSATTAAARPRCSRRSTSSTATRTARGSRTCPRRPSAASARRSSSAQPPRPAATRSAGASSRAGSRAARARARTVGARCVHVRDRVLAALWSRLFPPCLHYLLGLSHAAALRTRVAQMPAAAVPTPAVDALVASLMPRLTPEERASVAARAAAAARAR